MFPFVPVARVPVRSASTSVLPGQSVPPFTLSRRQRPSFPRRSRTSSFRRPDRSVGAGLTTRSSEQRLAVRFLCLFRLASPGLSLSLSPLGPATLLRCSPLLSSLPSLCSFSRFLPRSPFPAITIQRRSPFLDCCSSLVCLATLSFFVSALASCHLHACSGASLWLPLSLHGASTSAPSSPTTSVIPSTAIHRHSLPAFYRARGRYTESTLLSCVVRLLAAPKPS